MAVEIGALRALLSLDSAAFEAGAKRAQASMSGLQRRLEQTGQRMQRIGTQMTTRITMPLVAATGLMMRQSVKTAVEIKRMAALANSGTTEFQRFAAGARGVGIEQEKLSDILKDVNDRVGDFLTTGGGPMADFFENIAPKVGVTADQFARLSGPEALQLYVSSLEKAGVSQQEMTFYMEAMASDATALTPLLRNNGEEMDRLANRAQSLGAIMDEKTIASLNRSNDALRDLRLVGSALSNQISAALAPAFEALVKTLTSVGQWFSQLSPQMRTLIVVAGGLAAAIGPVLIGVGLMASGFSVAVAAVSGLVAALFTLRGALMATGIGAVVVLAGVLADWFLKLVERVGGFGKAMGLLGEVAGAVWQGIIDSAAAIPPALDGVWSKMQAGFLRALSGMANGFYKFSRGLAASMASSPLLSELGAGLMNISVEAGIAASDLAAAADAANAKASSSFASAAGTIRDAFGPAREAIAAMRAETDGASDGMDNASQAANDLKAALDGIAGGEDGGTGGGAGGGAGGAAGRAADALRKVRTDAEDTADAIRQKFDDVAKSIGDALAGAIVQGKSMGEALGRVFQQIAQDLISSGITKMIKSLFGGFFGGAAGGGGGFFGSLLGGLFGGFRADGGPVSAGRAYMVGERGPEMIVPKASGMVIPNDVLRAKMPANAPAAPSVDVRQKIVNVLDPAIVGDFLSTAGGEELIVNVMRKYA